MSAKKSKSATTTGVHVSKKRKRGAHSKHESQSKQTFFTEGRCR